MIGQIVSHYRILEKLGEGGMGAVYLAEDTHLGRRVAIKFPSDKADEHHYRARFLREARAISELSHPNIAKLYDYGETSDGQPFIIMELAVGPTLSELMRDDKLTLARTVEIITDVAEALSEAHRHGIIHRDIKPSNIVINEAGQVKVLDFGLAKQLYAEHLRSADSEAKTLLTTQTHTGIVIGTPLYLSPEQARGMQVDARSDLFALGAVLYECLTGQPSFPGASVLEIAAKVIHVEPPPPSTLNPQVSPELDRITLKALAKRPEARYQSAAEMVTDLRAAGDTLQDKEQRPTLAFRASDLKGQDKLRSTFSAILQRPVLRRPRFSVVSVVVALCLIALAWWAIPRIRQSGTHQPSPEALRWYTEGTNALRDGTYYKSSQALERAVEMDQTFALAHARLAEAWTELDYAEKAKDEILRASSLVPDRSALPPLEALYLDAITNTVGHDFASAIKSYQAIVKQTPDNEKPYAYVDLGRAYEKNEDTAKAVDSYLQATNLNVQYPTAYLRLGVLYGRKQDLTNASHALDKAEEIYQSLGNVEGRAEVLYQRGLLFRNIGKIPEAHAQLQKALDLAKATGNISQQILSMLQLSTVFFSESNTSTAEQYAREAVELAQHEGMESLTARGLVDLGTAFFVHGDYDEAEKYFRQGLEVARRYQGRRNEARALLSLGSMLIQKGKIDEGVSNVEQALGFYKQGGYLKETAQALILLGRAKRQQGDYEGARQAFEQDLQLAKQTGDQSQLALSEAGVGSVLMEQEQYAEALHYFEQEYEVSKAVGNQNGVGYSLLNRGDVLWHLGHYEEARAVFDEALALADRPSGGYKALTATVYASQADMNLSERRYTEAKARIQQALAKAGTPDTSLEVDSKRILGLAQVFSGAKPEGRQSCEEALTMAEHSGNPSLLASARLSLAQALLEEGDAQKSRDLAVQAQENFKRLGKSESEWRAWLVAARASQRAGDHATAQEFAAHAAELLSGLQQKWTTEDYQNYSKRSDVQYLRKQLEELNTNQ